MTDGFFNDLEGVETGIKDGPYPGFITKSEVITKKDSTKAWVITYRVAEGASKGENVQEWFNTYPNDAEKNENAKKWRKRRLESLGVPESAIPTFDPASIVGTAVIFKVKTKDGYTNISSVVLANETTWQPLNGNATSAPATPAASAAAPQSQEAVANLM